MTEGIEIIQGDCAAEIPKFGPCSVDLVVTSPPYGTLRTCYCDFDFPAIAKALATVLVPGGAICWNVGAQMVDGSETLTPFKQAIFFVEECGLCLHDTMIYQKRNFSHPEKRRYHQVFEYIFVLTKCPLNTFNPLVDRPNLTAGKIGNLGVNTFTEADGTKSVRSKKLTREFGMRHNVWLGNTRGQEDMCVELKHPAMMPKWLARDLILSFSNPGDLVCDPFSGSGTTAFEAIKAGRRAVAIDNDARYVSMLRDNIPPAGLPI